MAFGDRIMGKGQMIKLLVPAGGFRGPMLLVSSLTAPRGNESRVLKIRPHTLDCVYDIHTI